jgi:hypothetical protein
VAALTDLVSFAYWQLLSELFVPTSRSRGKERGAPASEKQDRRRLGLLKDKRVGSVDDVLINLNAAYRYCSLALST